MEDVESTGSVPSPEATVTKETPASGSRMMRARSVSPKPRYTSLGTLQSGVSKREPRVKTSEPIQKKLAQLQRQVSEVTTPLTQQVQQTSETVSQAQIAATAAYQKATEVAAENVQARIAAETALKKAGEIAAENVQLRSEVERAIQAQLQEVSGVTDAKIAAVVQEVTQQLSTHMSQSQEEVVQRQNVELQELKQELSQIKMQYAQKLSEVQMSGQVESGAVQKELQTLQSTLHKEMLTRSQQQNSLQGDVTKMATEQDQYAKQIIDLQGELYERTQQLATTLETMNTMAREMNEIKRKVTRWEREEQSVFPDHTGTSMPEDNVHNAGTTTTRLWDAGSLSNWDEPATAERNPATAETSAYNPSFADFLNTTTSRATGMRPPATTPVFPNTGFSRLFTGTEAGRTTTQMNVQWRPKEPPVFCGKSTEDAHTWVSVVSNYFVFMNGTPHQEVAYAITLLREAAHDWWQSYLSRRRNVLPPDWATLSAALLDRFGSKLRAKQALADIMTLQQGNRSVREYAAEFEKNTGRLDSSDEATLLQLFVWGLQRDIAEKVSLAHPTSLANAIAAAEEIELAVRFSRRPIAHAQHTSGQKTASYNTGNKGARSKGRWYRGRGGNRGGTQYFAGNRGGGQQTQSRNVMSLGNNITCHRCGRQGHIAPNCPQKSNYRGGSQNGRNGGGRRGNGRRRGGTRFAVMDATAEAEAMDIDSEQQLESADTGAPQVGN